MVFSFGPSPVVQTTHTQGLCRLATKTIFGQVLLMFTFKPHINCSLLVTHVTFHWGCERTINNNRAQMSIRRVKSNLENDAGTDFWRSLLCWRHICLVRREPEIFIRLFTYVGHLQSSFESLLLSLLSLQVSRPRLPWSRWPG